MHRAIITITGTHKKNLLEAVNKPGVMAALEELQSDGYKKGSWALVPAYDPVEVLVPAKGTKRNTKNPKMVPKTYKNKCLLFLRGDDVKDEEELVTIIIGKNRKEEVTCQKADRCGYIIYKDTKEVLFYTNDLATDVPNGEETFLIAKNGVATQEMIECVRGLCTLKRWTDASYAGRTKFQAPAIVVAYNMFMNAVDVMDQYREANITKRKDKRVSLGLFFFLMDLCVHNAFAIYTKLRETNPDLPILQFPEFKRKICVSMVTPQMNRRDKEAMEVKLRRERKIASAEKAKKRLNELRVSVGVAPSNLPEASVEHRLARTSFGKTYGSKKPQHERINCIACKMAVDMGEIGSQGAKSELLTSWCCLMCKSGFHPECFVMWHNAYSTSTEMVDLKLAARLKLTEEAGLGSKRRISQHIPDGDDVDDCDSIPCLRLYKKAKQDK